MRKLVRRAEEKSAYGRAFRERLKENTKYAGLGREATTIERLKVISWHVAKALRKGTALEEDTVEERAAGLAMALRNKMERKLSRDPVVTALALKIYHEELPGLLMTQWTAMGMAGTASLEEARAAFERRNKAASERGKQAARTRALRDAEAKVARAATALMPSAETAAMKPEERQRAQARLKEAQEALRRLKETHAAAEEQEAREETREALRALKGNGGAPMAP
jgi:hypothetical protein